MTTPRTTTDKRGIKKLKLKKARTVRDLDPKAPSTVKGGIRMPSDDGGEVAQTPPAPR